MLSETLTSLAMLKVSVDHKHDYLDYLRPFILQILIDKKPEPITDSIVANYMRQEYGLEIPERAIQIVLKRISRRYNLKREAGVYTIVGTLPDQGIARKKSNAARHIQAVIEGLCDFSKHTAKPITSADDAVKALLAFLSKFNIQCLRAYLRGTSLPVIDDSNEAHHIVLVSKYITLLQKNAPERFESFLVLLQGHMLANALMCPDLQNAPKTYKKVTFYLDTPLLVQRLGLEGEAKRAAIVSLIDLLYELGASVAVFEHSRRELEGVVNGAADHIDSVDGRGTIVMEARRVGRTRSDLLLLAGQIDEKLAEAKIETRPTPEYVKGQQIDETVFSNMLEDEVSYYNPRAKEDDINSVRSIYVLRSGTTPTTIEKSIAVLVSSNSGFARAAFQYGQHHEDSHEVSSVITDFSLANTAWLKAPMGAPSLPEIEVLAFAYAALRPSKELLDKYMIEIERLEQRGKITARDHQLLRSSSLAQDELMGLTLGDEKALTEETITETLHRVSSEIKKEESKKIDEEKSARLQAEEKLATERAEKNRIAQRLYWRCDRRARRLSYALASCIAALLIIGTAAGLGLQSSNPVLAWILLIGFGFLTIVAVLNIIFGVSVKQLRERLQGQLRAWLLKRELAVTGVELRSLQ